MHRLSSLLLSCLLAAPAVLASGCEEESQGTAVPDSGGDAGQDASKPKPDAKAPETGSPEASSPEASAPDSSAPDAIGPEASTPDASMPDADGSAPSVVWHTPLTLASSSTDTADPHCILENGTWYLYPTSSKKDFDLWTSTDLVQWTYRGVVWQPTAGTWNDVSTTGTFGAWAPSVHKGDDGAFYMYYTAGARVGVARADTPLGPFVDVFDHPLLGDGHGGVGDGVQIGSSSTDMLNYQEFSIDAFVLKTSKGKRYLYATIYVPMSVIAVWPMTDMTTLASNSPTVLLSPNFAWEGVINEGVFVNESNGRFILTYSGNQFATSKYALGAAVADDPMGPFSKDDTNPFLASGDAPDIWGPGHHSFVEDGHGGMLIVYHAKSGAADGADRQIRIGPVVFGSYPAVTVAFP